MTPIPQSLHKHFWDVDPKTLDLPTHKRFIIERLLHYGNEQSWPWLKANFTNQEMTDIASHSRELSLKDKNFYLLCLR